MTTMLSPRKRRCMNGAGVLVIALVLVAGMTGCSDCAPEDEVAVAADEMKYEQGADVAHSKEFRIAEGLEPLITVISPEEGAQWVIGETYDIIWESRGIEEVDIYLGEPPPPILPKSLYTKIVAGVPAAKGVYSWTIPDETSPRADVWIAVVRAGFHPLAGLPGERPEGFVIGRSASFRIVHAPTCLIATAANGTPMAGEIEVLREFRDEYLLTNRPGQAFVDFYYRVSPPIAEFITEHPGLKPIVRAALMPAVAISTIVVDTAPAEKTAIAALLGLVSVTLAVWATRRRNGRPQHA